MTAAVASVMVYFRDSLATATERSRDPGLFGRRFCSGNDDPGRNQRGRAHHLSGNRGYRGAVGGKREQRWSRLATFGLTSGKQAEAQSTSPLIGVTDPDETEMAAIADIFRPVVARDGVFADLQTLSQTDSLTGLANRRGLDEFLAGHCVDAEDITWNDDPEAFGQRLDVTLVLLDLDHFKIYNDMNGHPGWRSGSS